MAADHTDPAGHRATHEREAGLAPGARVAVAASQEKRLPPDPDHRNKRGRIVTLPGP
jgi:hypothetical protein